MSLNDAGSNECDVCGSYNCETMLCAACVESEMAALRAENERLHQENSLFRNVASSGRDLIAAQQQAAAALVAAIEAMDAKLEVESSFEDADGESYVAFYRVPAGPWHKILGLIRG